jgi:K+-sensing histidine kinase KdpD
MKNFFRNHPMVAMCVAMIVAAVATIWAENHARGGAVFHIRLPLTTLPD